MYRRSEGGWQNVGQENGQIFERWKAEYWTGGQQNKGEEGGRILELNSMKDMRSTEYRAAKY